MLLLVIALLLTKIIQIALTAQRGICSVLLIRAVTNILKYLKTYQRAWELRQIGFKLKDIGEIMGYKGGDWPRRMIWRTDQKIATQKRLPEALMELVEKY